MKDREAYRFSLLSELGGEVMYSILEGEDGAIYIATSFVSIPGSGDRDYSAIIEQMQKSLRKK